MLRWKRWKRGYFTHFEASLGTLDLAPSWSFEVLRFVCNSQIGLGISGLLWLDRVWFISFQRSLKLPTLQPTLHTHTHTLPLKPLATVKPEISGATAEGDSRRRLSVKSSLKVGNSSVLLGRNLTTTLTWIRIHRTLWILIISIMFYNLWG